MICFTIAMTTTAQVNLEDGLVGYFPLNGNADDYSALEIHGVNYGATPTTNEAGVINSAMNFSQSGTNYVSAGNDLRGITDQMTLSFWFKTTSMEYEFMVEKYDWSRDAGFIVSLIDGGVALHGRDGSGQYVGPPEVGSYADGEWHHVLAIIDRNEWLIYVDCKKMQDYTTTTANPNIAVNSPLSFGRYAYYNSNHLNGSLDEIRIYNRILTARERNELCRNISARMDEMDDVFVLYPNPTNGIIHIKGIERLGGSFNVEIRDYAGQLIRSANVSDIDISDLASGIYFVELLDAENQKVFQKKIIKN